MTDQNNSSNSQPPAQQSSANYIPGNIIFTNNVPGGQWITYTVNGIDYGTAQAVVSSTDQKQEKKAKKKEEDGCVCKKCADFKHLAEPNQENGTFICWACRHNY